MQSADTPDLISSAIAAALAEHSGDLETATEALVRIIEARANDDEALDDAWINDATVDSDPNEASAST